MRGTGTFRSILRRLALAGLAPVLLVAAGLFLTVGASPAGAQAAGVHAANAGAPVRVEQSPALAARMARMQLMLGASTGPDDMVAAVPYHQGGRAFNYFVAAPVGATLETATELAVAPEIGAPVAFVAMNEVLVRFEEDTTLGEAFDLAQRLGAAVDARPSTAGRNTFAITTPSAFDAFFLADALAVRPGVRWAMPNGVANIETPSDIAPAGGPEIRVEDSGMNNIADGGAFDFGTTTQGLPVQETFTIHNDGASTLIIDIVEITAAGYTVVTQPGTPFLAPTMSTTFTVEITADAVGNPAATLQFLNNDADENPFNFNLTGMVQAPAGAQEIAVFVNGSEIMNNAEFDFGETPEEMPLDIVFEIRNIGGAALSVGAVSVPEGYLLTVPPASSVAPGGLTAFTVQLVADAQGTFAGDLLFLNNDADENPFVLMLTGDVIEPSPIGEISVEEADGTPIPTGGSVAFGATDMDLPILIPLIIRNAGPGELSIGQIVTPAGFSVTINPLSPLPVGQATALGLQLDAGCGGSFGGAVSIPSNDPDESPYIINVSGSVTEPPPTGGIDDRFYFNQWHHDDNVDQFGLPGGYDVRTPAAWEVTLGEGAIVAVMDDGFQADHPDIRNNVIAEFLNQFSPVAAQFGGPGSHGTAVAGCIAATPNYCGGRGTAPRASLIVTNVFTITLEQAAEAMDFANANGASVHSNSWVFTNPSFLPDILRDKIIELTNTGRGGKGMLFLFAAGNDRRPAVYSSSLASMPETVCVAALNSEGRRSGYSSYGPTVDFTSPSNGGMFGIYTTDVTGPFGYNNAASLSGGDFTPSFGGTSAATPIAAGVAGLVFSVNPSLYADQVRRILTRTARKDPIPGADRIFQNLTRYSDSFGFGLIDAQAAVAAAIASIQNGGLTWPAPATGLTATRGSETITLQWTNPPADARNEYDKVLVVRYNGPTLWMPQDGVDYTLAVGDSPDSGVTILAFDDISSFEDSLGLVGRATYAVYSTNVAFNYGTPVVHKAFPSEPITIFFDDMEGADPGWNFVDMSPSWERGVPDTANITFAGTYSCNGAPCNLNGIFGTIPFPPSITAFNTPYSGANVMATDLDGVYPQNTTIRAISPVIDLSNLAFGSYSLSFRELLDVEGNGLDRVRLRVVDADTNDPIRTLLNNHQELTYTWREQWFDLRNQRGRRIVLYFDVITDNIGQYKGWIIDDIRVGASLGTSGPDGPGRPRRIRLPGVGIPPSENPMPEDSFPDLNGNGMLDADDAVPLLGAYGSSQSSDRFDADSDLNQDGEVNAYDLLLFLDALSSKRDPVSSR